MEPSSSSRRRVPVAAWLDRAALAGLIAGVALTLWPAEGMLRWGFWTTLAFTIFHIVTSHLDRTGDA